MRVPKMAKNGFNLVLPVSPVFEETKYPKKSGIDTKPKAVPRSWRANKNHFRPISEQACALKRRLYGGFLKLSALLAIPFAKLIPHFL